MAAGLSHRSLSHFISNNGFCWPDTDQNELVSEPETMVDAQPRSTTSVSATNMSTREQTNPIPVLLNHASSEAPVTIRVEAGTKGVSFDDHYFMALSKESLAITSELSGVDPLKNVTTDTSSLLRWGWDTLNFDHLPNEILTHILGFLDVNDLLATSRINHHLRQLSVAPILRTYRLQRARYTLPPLLTSPSRPTLAELIKRHIFLTKTTQISRRLARNLVAIRLSRCLPQRPSAETLVQRGVLPPECVPGCGGCTSISPALVAKRRAVEKEKLKDSLRHWVGGVWRGEVKERSEGVRQWEERAGVGRVWRLRRFWERIGRESTTH
ncbi:hypothetical protein F5Y16DRAFT_400246 [Xylariaceae sp. FL0255]|nr:hypothetical protein F5Y16DRAFT_400246 [Xylariaceae sp. FL0255]